MAEIYRLQVLFGGAQVVGGGVSTFHFLSTGTALETLANGLSELWGEFDDDMAASTPWEIDRDVQRIDVATGNVVGVETIGNYSGGGSGENPLPPANQALIRWRTGFYIAGRELRGRTFVPAMLEANSDGGKPSSALLTRMTTSIADFLNDVDEKLVSYSPTHHAAAVVTSASVWGNWAVLRSRRD